MRYATLGQASQVLDLINQKGVPREQLQQLLDEGVLSDLLDAQLTLIDRVEFRRMLGLARIYEMQRAEQTTWRALIAEGNYDEYSLHADLNVRNSLNAGKFDVCLVRLKKAGTRDEVLDLLSRKNLHAAGLGHLLAFGIAHPKEQLSKRIIAIIPADTRGDGSVVAMLYSHGTTRGLTIHQHDRKDSLSDDLYILAMRN